MKYVKTYESFKVNKKEEELKRELILLSIIDTREERGFERILKKNAFLL